MERSGTRLQFTYRAPTPGRSGVDEETSATETRLVEPVAWLNHCHLRIFLAEDGYKYRVSGIRGNAIIVDGESQVESNPEEAAESD